MTDFHFIRPLALWLIIAVFFVLYLIKKWKRSQSGWQSFLPAHLAKVLLESDNSQSMHVQDKNSAGKAFISTITASFIPFVIGLLTVLALAGPTWEKLPQPVYQVARGSVLIMDMSYSMYATDLAPNRLTHARYKASDLLDEINEGDLGLVAYAGDAFVISPLTEDINNIKLLLPAVSPDIMPELGSNPLVALMLADEMLKNAGHVEGDIYWFTDGIDTDDLQDINEWSSQVPHKINILGIGTQTGAPIKLPSGELFKDNNGSIVLPSLPQSTKNQLAGIASRSHGNYQTIRNDNKDLTRIINAPILDENGNRTHTSGTSGIDGAEDEQSDNLNMGDQWQEFGPYLLLLILPLFLTYFRRGNYLLFIPFSLLLMPTEKAYAFTWDDLWKTKNQQAQKKFNDEQFTEAGEQFVDKNWQASSYYKAKEFDKALSAFEKDDSATGLFNQGNTLVQLQKYKEALERYQQALQKDPNFTDAKDNIETIKRLQEQQEEQQKNEGGESSDKEKNGEQKDQEQQGEQGDKSDDDAEQKEGDQQKDDQQGSDEQNSESKSTEDKDAESENEEGNSQQAKTDEEKRQEEQAKAEEAKALSEEEQKAAEEQEVKTAQQIAIEEKLQQELDEKHQQIFNKVTDDPYLLLRNKMKLEYNKRKSDGRSSGDHKKW